ncbi:hypothetical protein GCM10017687_54930 [Streptomyces echinatus]
MLSGRRYRLELTAEQAEQCEKFADVCRSVWNTGLEQRREYRRRGAWMNYAPQCKELAQAKCVHEWLKAAPSHILQQTLKDLDGRAGTTARSRSGGGPRPAGPPHFASPTPSRSLWSGWAASGGE